MIPKYSDEFSKFEAKIRNSFGLMNALIIYKAERFRRFDCKAILWDQKGENESECLQICQKTLCLGFSLPVPRER